MQWAVVGQARELRRDKDDGRRGGAGQCRAHHGNANIKGALRGANKASPLLREHCDSQTIVLFPPKTPPHHFHRQKVLCNKPNIYICIALKIINTPINRSSLLIE
jgi:hypothetical protein